MKDNRIRRRKRVTPLYMNQTLNNHREEDTSRYRRRKKNHKKNHLIALFSIVFILLVGIGVAKAFGLFNITMASNPPGSSPAPSKEQENMVVPLPDKTKEPNSGGIESQNASAAESETPQNTAVLPSPEPGSPAYMSLYPDLFVEKTEFIEHDPEDKVVYLTFDDGPCKLTPKLLDVLDDLDVKATFFVSAQFGSRDELIKNIKETDKRGHKVAVHTYSHDYNEIYASVEAFIKDYKKIDDIIMEATHKRAGIYRFPGGSNAGYNAKIRKELLKEMDRRGFVHHDWNAHNGDSEGFGPSEQVERAVREASYGSKSVILMHNTPDKDDVIKVLPQIVNQLKEKGYRFAVLDETVKPFQFETVEDK